jgi:putative PEP-CTERM system histidine kinase
VDTGVILAYFGALFAGGIALATAFAQRRSIVHWAFAGGMAVFACESLFAGLAADAVVPQDVVYWEHWRLVAVAFLPGTWLAFSLTYARGNYREFLARWRLLLIVAFLLPIGLALGFSRKLIAADQQSTTVGGVLHLTLPGLSLHLLFLLNAVLVLMNFERTFRASVGTMRWRIKFMLLGLGLLFAERIYSSSQVLLFRAVNLWLQPLNACALLLACLLIGRALLRTGHFEVSVYPSHAVLHNSLTVMVAGLYLVIVGVLARVVAALGGDAGFTVKAFVVLLSLVLLTMLLLSDRLRLRTKRFVSRHFQRPFYDYRTVWRTFTEGTARRVESAELCSAVAKLVSEIFQALSVSVWMVTDGKLTFASSTSLSNSKAGHLELEAVDAEQVIQALKKHPEPVDLDESKDAWASALRRLQPGEFQKGGNRVCAPMIAGGELLGMVMVADRVGGVDYSFQDLDLLKLVSEQAAASLLNIQLSHKLSQGKQLEAFQAMSAFFVHDLKNTASTLSLMLQNLPVHFNDPQFRADALRGVSKTVTHINDLIGRLSSLRRDLTSHPVEADLSEIVAQAIKSLPIQPGVAVASELRSLPKVMVDREQIHSVVTNLVLNANDAVGPSGSIRVETSQRDGWEVVAISDNGCGMSPDFVQHSLFRPFQTTKKQGIGIGMFQCKMIIEAHRGRIEVQSELGKGTTFRVLLPMVQAS